MRSTLPLFPIVCAFGLAACSDPSDPGPVPALLEIVDGNNQEVWLGGPYDSLRVRVADRDGIPLEGVSVRWATSAGILGEDGLYAGSHILTTTDTTGIARVRWDFNGAPVGTYETTAAVADLPSVTFVAHNRQGMELKGVEFTPAEVNVSAGPALVRVAVTASDDFLLGLTGARVRFLSPTGDQQVPQELELVSGTRHDGRWEGDVEIPAGAEAGVWTLAQVTIYSGCHRWRTSFAETLAYNGFPSELTVTNTGASNANLQVGVAPSVGNHPGCPYSDRP
jgi:hypothetical protein